MATIYHYFTSLKRAPTSPKKASSGIKNVDKTPLLAKKEIEKTSSEAPKTLEGRTSIGFGKSLRNLFARFAKRFERSPQPVAKPTIQPPKKPIVYTLRPDKEPTQDLPVVTRLKKPETIHIGEQNFQVDNIFVKDIDRDMHGLYIGDQSFYQIDKEAIDKIDDDLKYLQPQIERLNEVGKKDSKPYKTLLDQSNTLKAELKKTLLHKQLQVISEKLGPKRIHLLPQITVLMNQNGMADNEIELTLRHPSLYWDSSDRSATQKSIVLNIPEDETQQVTITATFEKTYHQSMTLRDDGSGTSELRPLAQSVVSAATSTYTFNDKNGEVVVTGSTHVSDRFLS